MTTPEDPSDRLIDSLLREQARRRAADEELIASIHAALDGAGGKTTARMKRFSPRMGLLLASAAAVVLAAGGIALNQRGNNAGRKEMAMEPSANLSNSKRPEQPLAVATDPAAPLASKAPELPPARPNAVEAPPAEASPEWRWRMRFLAWDDAVARAKIDLVDISERTKTVSAGEIEGLDPQRRTFSRLGSTMAADGRLLRLLLGGRTNPDGTPAYCEVDTSGVSKPLVLILLNNKVPSGLTAVVVDDDEKNFEWGSYMVLNATSENIAMTVDHAPSIIPTGWKPVLIKPKGTDGLAAIELRTYQEPAKLAASMKWRARQDERTLVVLHPGTDKQSGGLNVKMVQETNPYAAVEAPPAPDLAANDARLPIMPEPATPRPGLNEAMVARRVMVDDGRLPAPDAPSEALADAQLPPGLDTGRGAGPGSGGGRGSGSGVGSGTGPGRGVGDTYDRSLGDRRTNQAQVAGISHDAIPGSPRAFDKERGVVQPNDGANGERYGQLVDQPWKSPWQDPLSTFSIDVDAASYTNIRRMIRAGRSIPPDAVRIEECLNYFDYRYEGPKGNGPFAVLGTLVKSPLQAGHLLARVAIKGREIENNARPASNLVFLIDVSGSMQDTMKLPLLQRSLELLLDQLDERDQVGIVVYAGNEGVVLDSTRLTGEGKTKALRALKELEAGGSTNGGAGIKRAYEMAASHFIPGGVNRVILATDGDFNVGTTSQNDLVELVKEKAKSGVNLTVTSFGEGNLNDSMMEAITKDGNGNYYYIDNDNEARRIFLEKLTGTLVTIAKDVKIQVEFNPGKVKAYRLLGYADRILKHEDFNNDKVDAGDIGAGHTVTALYEIVPQGAEMPNLGGVDPLRYQKPEGREMVASEEWMTLKLRYKAPDGDVSSLVETPLKGEPQAWEESGNDMRFASAVALFGMKLRGMPEAKEVPWSRVVELAKPALAEDPHEQRAEFLELVRKLEEGRREDGKR